MALLAALGHLANLGQLVDIGQGQAHHREQIRWSRRNYVLDAQALKIDLLGAARDDVRGTYDTYIERLDTLLLLDALLLPFALNTLQFSDQFVPRTEEECPECIEARHPWLAILWVYLVGLCLIMPFWSLLMLLRCKLKLDNWLQHTLDQLQELRRELITCYSPISTFNETAFKGRPEELIATEQEAVVARLGGFIVEYQDLFSDLWGGQCAPLVFYATRLLWSSACGAIALTGLMFWIFLANRRGQQNMCHVHFLWLLLFGLLAPLVAFCWKRCRRRARGGGPLEPEVLLPGGLLPHGALARQPLVDRGVSALSAASPRSAGGTPRALAPKDLGGDAPARMRGLPEGSPSPGAGLMERTPPGFSPRVATPPSSWQESPQSAATPSAFRRSRTSPTH